MTDYPVAYADKPNAAHWRRDTVTWDEILEWVAHPAKRKECGNYILATLEETTKIHPVRAGESGPGEPCKDIHRDNRSVSRRSAILALDIDKPDDGFDLVVETVLAAHVYAMHTTHSSTPSEPRYRLLVPTDRDMAPDEYVAATTALATRLGKDQFDSGTFEPARFMFKPATRRADWYDVQINDGEPVEVDTLLDEYDRDLSELPAPKPGKNKRDPYEIEGPVGAFNRVYADLDDLIESYDLPYEKVSDDRYTLRGSAAEAGFGPVSGVEGLYYSHHANDPAYGVTCSAFDLVRLHWYKTEDETADSRTPINRLPSTEAMMGQVTKDPRVVSEMFDAATEGIGPLGDDYDEAEDVSWRANLVLNNRGRFVDDIRNWDLIRANDPVFARLYFNELTMAPECSGDLPWRTATPTTRTFDGIDHAELRDYIERTYTFRPAKEQLGELVMTKAGKNRINPVREYLESLVWDGKERVETSITAAQDNRYNRLVARKVLAAAVARMYVPGIKWDHTLVLQGDEGLGKSTWIERLATVGIDDRLATHYSLGPINSKDTLLAMHRSWIVTADEGHSLRKADNDAIKEFLTRTHDVFRMPYDRDTMVHPRRCVIWSSTNDETFLRRQEGNRRFLMVKCFRRFDFDLLTPEYVDQLWAEAVHIYKSGELLYLTDDEALLARLERNPYIEEDSNAGVIQEYLETKVPMDWWTMSPPARVSWLESVDSGFEKEGDNPISKTCTRQLWHEALRQRVPPRRSDLLDLAGSLKELGWVSTGHHRVPGYGNQTVYVRKEDML